jgi:hypothetical protein
MSKESSSAQKKIERRLAQIRREITEIGLVCPGTLTKRFNTCGKPSCRCAQDPNARHGPYYDWTHREDRRFVHKLVSASQARELERAIKNHKRALDLFAEWGRESARLILAQQDEAKRR